jgi:uncharacterized protein (DUF1501 family)
MLANRRQFLAAAAGSLPLISLSPGAPRFLRAAAEAPSQQPDRVLVVVQLSGGNDGLNTIVPFTDDLYYRLRPTLAVPKDQVLKIDDRLGFHPALAGLAKLLEAGRLSIVQGVGYPQPNRSHFESMDIWHTAQADPSRRTVGWLGRYLDTTQGQSVDAPALHLGPEKQPLALAALAVQSPSIQSLERFRLEQADSEPVRGALESSLAAERSAPDDLLRFAQASTTAAVTSSRRVEAALGKYWAAAYPQSGLAARLKTVAQLIDAGSSTRIYYVALDGFDTHSLQGDAHAGLLTQLGGALQAFYDDLAQHGHARRVLSVCFSEFGRRVKENASRGTDHGAAAPLLLAGGQVKPGLLGVHPSLTDLDDGDLKHHTDFRRVYAAILEHWLGQPSQPILGAAFEPLPLFQA